MVLTDKLREGGTPLGDGAAGGRFDPRTEDSGAHPLLPAGTGGAAGRRRMTAVAGMAGTGRTPRTPPCPVCFGRRPRRAAVVRGVRREAGRGIRTAFRPLRAWPLPAFRLGGRGLRPGRVSRPHRAPIAPLSRPYRAPIGPLSRPYCAPHFPVITALSPPIALLLRPLSRPIEPLSRPYRTATTLLSCP